MTSHFALVFAVAFAAAAASFVSYDGGKNRSVRVAVSIVLLLAVAHPVVEIAFKLLNDEPPVFSEWGGEVETEYEDVALDAFTEGIKQLLSEQYSLGKDNFGIKIEGFDFKKMKAERIYVTLYGRAALCDPLAVERLINGYGLGECYAKIGI